MSGDAPLRASPSALSCVASLLGHTERVWSVSWHPSGRLLASCSSDKTIRVWRHSGDEWASGWECCAVLDAAHTRTVRSVSWSPCGRLLASAGFDGRVTVWAVKQHSATSREQQQRGGEEEEKGEEERSSETGGAVSSGRVSAECVCALEGHESEVKSVSWSADGRLLASCSRDKSVWVWERDEAADGSLGFECVSVCSGHSADVKHVAFHPQLSLLLSASYDNSVRVWREEEEEAGGEWEAAQTLDGHSSTVWMADWLRPHQQKQQPAQPDTPPHSAVCESVVSAGDDRTVRVWSPTQPLSSHSAAAIAASTYACTQTLVTPHTRSIFALHQHAHSGSDSTHTHTQTHKHTRDGARHGVHGLRKRTALRCTAPAATPSDATLHSLIARCSLLCARASLVKAARHVRRGRLHLPVHSCAGRWSVQQCASPIPRRCAAQASAPGRRQLRTLPPVALARTARIGRRRQQHQTVEGAAHAGRDKRGNSSCARQTKQFNTNTMTLRVVCRQGQSL